MDATHLTRLYWKSMDTSSLKIPKKQTLDKYGLSESEWREIALRQGDVCAVCGKLPSSGRLNVDHQHVPKYSKLPPETRKRFVRGLLCYWCNYHVMAHGISIRKLRNALDYLINYERRLNETQIVPRKELDPGE